MRFLRKSRAVRMVLIIVGLGGLATAADKDVKKPDQNREQGTIHTVEARMGYATDAGIGIQAEKEPGEFTIRQGFKGTKLKYNFFNPKSGRTLTRLNGRNIFSMTEHRYMDELDKNPDFELPPGDYKFVVGGEPGATGTLTYTTVPSSDTKPPGNPPRDNKKGRGRTSPPVDRSPPPKDRLDPGGEGERGEHTAGLDWLYRGVWLPAKYLPPGYRHYPDAIFPGGDPPQGKISQSLWYGIPLQRKGGKASTSSSEHPYTVFIDNIVVYKSTALAIKNFQLAKEGPPTKTAVALGDEAYIDDNCKDVGSLFKEYSGKGGKIFRRDINIRGIRIGRVVFGLRVTGDQVEDFNPNGKNSASFVAYETPSRQDVLRVAEVFVGRVGDYAKEKGWLEDATRD